MSTEVSKVSAKKVGITLAIVAVVAIAAIVLHMLPESDDFDFDEDLM